MSYKLELKFHHIGVATTNLEMAVKRYEALQYQIQDDQIFEDKIQNVRIAFMYKSGDPLIELITPLSEKSPVDKILEKNGSTPYHTCYEVPSIDEFSVFARKNRFIRIIEPVPAVAFGGRRICFFFNKEIGVIELLENEIPGL